MLILMQPPWCRQRHRPVFEAQSLAASSIAPGAEAQRAADASTTRWPGVEPFKMALNRSKKSKNPVKFAWHIDWPWFDWPWLDLQIDLSRPEGENVFGKNCGKSSTWVPGMSSTWCNHWKTTGNGSRCLAPTLPISEPVKPGSDPQIWRWMSTPSSTMEMSREIFPCEVENQRKPYGSYPQIWSFRRLPQKFPMRNATSFRPRLH